MKTAVNVEMIKIKRNVFWFVVVASMLAGGFPAASLCAEEAVSESTSAASATDWKQEISSDKDALKTEKDQIKTNRDASRQEEKALQSQIKQAMQSGDTQTAESLKAQLQTMHQENVQQKQEDEQSLKAARHELASDKKEARTDRMDVNNDGKVDQVERAQYKEKHGNRDRDNNPPGPAGGPGTNWENRPGPQGGPGASPNRGNQGARGRGTRARVR